MTALPGVGPLSPDDVLALLLVAAYVAGVLASFFLGRAAGRGQLYVWCPVCDTGGSGLNAEQLAAFVVYHERKHPGRPA